jgi:hypothetical protein
MPTPPAGTAGKTTKILGEHFASCTAQTQLFVCYGLGSVLNLSGAQYVDVACLELTDHSQCSTQSGAPGGCQKNYPLDDYAGNGIVTNASTANVSLIDLDIHGFTHEGINGPLGGTVLVDHVRIAYNGWGGWDFDDGAGTPSAAGALLDASYLTIQWNGCNEEYPIVDAFPAQSCYDDNSGGYGDGVGTPGTTLNVTCDHCTFDHNTQDGLDLLHTSGSQIQVTHSSSFANMGQQWKMGAMASVVFRDNVTVHNCRRMSTAIAGAAATYNAALSDFCRAAGDGIALLLAPTSQYTFQNNTFVGYGSTSYDLECGSADCTGASFTYQNNVNVGYPSPSDQQLPGLFYMGTGIPANLWAARDHNIFYNFRNGAPCPSTFASETCGSPLLVNQPTWTGEASLDNLDFHISASSPARDTGLTIGEVSDDYFGNQRPKGPAYDIGAHEF